MFYEVQLTIPPGTPAFAPVRETMPVHPGKVHAVEIIFPDGCTWDVAVVIYLWSQQVWPSNPDAAFHGNNERIAFAEDFLLDQKPYEFEVRGWAPDTRYEHTPIVRIGVLSETLDVSDLIKMLSGPLPAGG